MKRRLISRRKMPGAGVKVGRHYRRYGVGLPADSASEIVKFTISIPRESVSRAPMRRRSIVVV